jgi:hypothetical protein
MKNRYEYWDWEDAYRHRFVQYFLLYPIRLLYIQYPINLKFTIQIHRTNNTKLPLITLMYVQIWIKSLLQSKPAVRYIFYGRHTNHIVFRSFMYVQNRIKIELIFNWLRNALKFNEKNSSVNLVRVWKLLIFMYSN